MGNLSIKDFIIERCKIGKREGWKNLYSEISNEVYNKYGEVIEPEKIRYISKKYRKDNGLDENFDSVSRLDINYSDLYKCSMCNEDALLRENGFNPKDFSVTNYKTSSWTGIDGKEYTSKKISVKPKTDFVWTKDFMEKLLHEVEYLPKYDEYSPTNYSSNGDILIVPIVDLHYMRYSTTDFTNENYDTNIARHNFYKVIDSVVKKYSSNKLSKIYFIIGNDMLNCDNLEGTTTRGTKQENCSNIEKSIIEISNLLVNAIDKLKHLAPLDVIYVPSNHDYLTFFGIVNALRLRYELDKNVYIDSGYKERKYRKEGTCLFGFSHDIKIDKVNSLIINEAKEYVSDTKRRIFFLGHLHHEVVNDVDGTEVRRLSTMAGQSRWEYDKGYISVEKCQTFLVDIEHGIKEIFYIYMD